MLYSSSFFFFFFLAVGFGLFVFFLLGFHISIFFFSPLSVVRHGLRCDATRFFILMKGG